MESRCYREKPILHDVGTRISHMSQEGWRWHVTGRMVVACHRKDGEYIAVSQEADSRVNALLCTGRGWIYCSLSAAGVGVRIRISVVVLEPGVAGGSIIPKS